MIFFLRKTNSKKSPKKRKKKSHIQANHFEFLSKKKKNNNRRLLLMCKNVNSRNKNRHFSVPLLVQTLKSNLWPRKNTLEQLVESSLIFQLYILQSLNRIHTFIIFFYSSNNIQKTSTKHIIGITLSRNRNEQSLLEGVNLR